jgi:tRNA dimethylallyltransferase
VSVVAIFGPTASGKSAVAEELARRIPAELVSADSMQLYRGLPILTNQSTSSRIQLVAVWPLDHEGSVGEYERLAHAAIDDVLKRGLTPVVVGGTGLYLRAALAELELPPEPAPGTRERLEELYDRNGPNAAHALLTERDPAAAAAVHPNDRRRVVRALELSEVGSSRRPADPQLWSESMRHPTLVVGLDVPLAELDRRIEERTQAMFERGVQEEVARAFTGTVSATARYVLGLEEIATLPRAQAAAELAAATRRYARYQRKWMRRIPGLIAIRADRPTAQVADEVIARGRLAEAGARGHRPRVLDSGDQPR